MREEALGSKRVIHNHGHGGGGITLSWGTGLQALELGFAGAGKPYTVQSMLDIFQAAGGRVVVREFANHRGGVDHHGAGSR